MLPSREQFLEILNAPDCLTIVVRGQQAVERALDAAISEALPAPHALEVEKLSFALKADLAVALRVIRADSRGALLALYRVRNRFAHRFDAAFEQKEAEDFGNALSGWQRHLLGREPSAYTEPRDLLRNAIAVLFVECTSAQRRLQEAKLADEVLHEIVQETLAGAPARDENPFLTDVHREMRDRLGAKKAERMLPRGAG
jgi:hypothetical protein